MTNEIQSIIDEFETKLRAAIASDILARIETKPTGKLVVARPGVDYVAPRKAKPPSMKFSRSRLLQGQYLGRLRSLTGAVRARVQKTAKTEGVEAALRLADRLAPKKKN